MGGENIIENPFEMNESKDSSDDMVKFKVV